jgi:hypothetical protein
MLLERSSIKPKGFYGFIKPEVSTRAVDGRMDGCAVCEVWVDGWVEGWV